MAADFSLSSHFTQWIKRTKLKRSHVEKRDFRDMLYVEESQLRDKETFDKDEIWLLHLFFVEHIHHIGFVPACTMAQILSFNVVCGFCDQQAARAASASDRNCGGLFQANLLEDQLSRRGPSPAGTNSLIHGGKD
jgi:hypothetical protein